MKSKSLLFKPVSWLLSAFQGYAYAALFLSLIFSPGGNNVLLAQDTQIDQSLKVSAAPASSPEAVKALAQSGVGASAFLNNLKAPLDLPAPTKPGPTAKSKVPPLPERKPREKGLYKSKINLQKLDLSRPPGEEELRMAGQLGSELSPLFDAEPTKITDRVKRKKQEDDNLLMGQAMQKWNAHEYDKAVDLLRQHRAKHADSPWSGEAELHLGCASQFSGSWEQAKNSFEAILAAAPAGSDIYQKAKLRRSLLHVQQGELEEAKASFAEMLKTETSWERRTYAQRWLLETSHYQNNEVALRNCGSEAIAMVLRDKGMGEKADRVALLPGRTARGYSLGELTELARQEGLPATAVRADGSGQLERLPVPFIAHYRDRHYVVVEGLTEEKRVRLYDPRLKHEVQMERATFEAQWSGLALLFQDQQPEGIAIASQTDLTDAVGGCCGLPAYPGDLGPTCNSSCGMPVWSVNPVNLNVCVDDTPLWYDCGFGPKIMMQITYNSQDALNQLRPFGNKWVFSYTSYAMESPNSYVPQGSVLIVMPGGRGDLYKPLVGGGYTPPPGNFSKLTKLAPQGYEFSLELPDGTVYRYGVPDAMLPNGTSSLLKSITDRHGNQVSIVYDASGAIQKVKDPLNRECVFAYNAQGFVKWIDDPFGRRATFSYDAAGNLIGQTDMGGLSYGYTYDGDVYLTSIIKPSGTIQFYIEPSNHDISNGSDPYPPSGGVMWDNYRVTVTHPDSYAEEFYYDGYHRSGWHRDKRQYQSPLPIEQAPKTVYTFAQPGGSGSNGVITGITYEDGKYTAFASFDANLQAQSVRDENGGYAYYTFNAQGQVLTSRDARGNTTFYDYMPNGLDLWKVTDAKYVKQQERAYHPNSRDLASVTDATNNVTQFTYNSRGQLETVTNPTGHAFNYTYQYNASSKPYPTERISKVKQGTNVLGTEVFDELARTRAVTDADGLTVVYELDGLDRVKKIVHADSTFEQNDWGCCWLDKQTDRLGRSTTYWRNYAGQPLVVQDGADRLLQYQYDANGNLTALFDGKGNRTRWEYNGRNRTIKKIYADNSFYTYAYDGVGNLKQRTDAKNVTVTYGYNANNLLESISAPGLATISYTYDPQLDLMTSMTDGTGTTGFGYDAAGRVNSEDGPLAADVITTIYDAMGRVKNRTVNNDVTTTTTALYDGLERLQSFAGPLGTFTYGYRTAISPRLASVTYPNGQITAYDYHGSSKDFRLKEIWNKGVNGQSTLSKFNYDYDANGRITAWTQQLGTNVQQYALGYDAANQLTGAVLSSASIPTRKLIWSYDAAGNRTSEQIDDAVGQSTHNNLNQLTGQQGGGQITLRGQINEAGSVTVNGQPAAMEPDGSFAAKVQVAPGDTSVTVGATDLGGNSVTHTYQMTTTSGVSNRTLTYDENGNLINDGTRTFEWDPLNRLTAINYTGTNLRTEFSYDGLWQMARVVEKVGVSVASDKRLLWVNRELQPIEERDGTTNSVTKRFYPQGEQIGGISYYLTRDHLGSVRELADNLGGVQASYDYDLYGRRTKLAGSLEADFSFTGYYFHQPSGFHLALYRTYDTAQSRWLSRDPAGEEGGINLYQYSWGSPLNYVDPDGGHPAIVLAIVLLIVGAEWANAPGPDDPVYPGGSGMGNMCRVAINIGTAGSAATPIRAFIGTELGIGGGGGKGGKGGGGGKGERGYAGAGGSNNPYKHCKPHPTDPKSIIKKDPQTGKDIVKPKPPDFDDYWKNRFR
jgi:RHS repeat-associated protein